MGGEVTRNGKQGAVKQSIYKLGSPTESRSSGRPFRVTTSTWLTNTRPLLTSRLCNDHVFILPTQPYEIFSALMTLLVLTLGHFWVLLCISRSPNPVLRSAEVFCTALPLTEGSRCICVW